ncbi:MAG TPA: tRNA pseudouridine(55) synthase TruB [Gammaproteobacteria bacterium]|nr:tRNA pseudouridine(55) synthase TruB [Gammaproteobacteria bacterium]
MNGFLLIDKPSGITSAECVSRIKKILNEKKVGHCGTLDPLATGMLPICVGEATKFSSYVSNQSKGYLVKVLFGVETDTGDITGKELSTSKINFSLEELKAVLEGLSGELEQIPPMYSALKQKGKPLYYWARKGVSLKREPRFIQIEKIKLKSLKVSEKIELEIFCSKGTYIRSLIQSIGKQLNTPATVLELRRTHIGYLNEGHLTQVTTCDKDKYLERILDIGKVLRNLPKVVLNKNETKKIINGQQVDYNARREKEGIVRLYEKEGSFIGIGSVDSSMKVSPKRLINTQKYSASPSI